MIPTGPTYPPLKKHQHSHARAQHEDGSLANICAVCKNSSEEDKIGRIRCLKHKASNMRFGNCDDWWPIDETVQVFETVLRPIRSFWNITDEEKRA